MDALTTVKELGALGLLGWLLWRLTGFFPSLVGAVHQLRDEVQGLRLDLAQVAGLKPTTIPAPSGAEQPKEAGYAMRKILGLFMLVALVVLVLPACSSWPFGSNAGDGTSEANQKPATQVTINQAPTYVQGAPQGNASPSNSAQGSTTEGDRSGTGGAATTTTKLRTAAELRKAADALEADATGSPPAGG